ncbi:hypothetical protein JCM14720_01080 [Calditerricola yamamurae]
MEEVTKLTYPDGSISVTTREIPIEGSGETGDIGSLAVDTSTGKVSCGTGYCRLVHKYGRILLSYIF